MENFKFLTTINGIYNIDSEAEDFNVISHLEVYANEDSEIIKIKYHELIFDSTHAKDYKNGLTVDEGQYSLDLGEMQNSYIIENINEKCIKALIFANFNDYRDRYFNFQKIF